MADLPATPLSGPPPPRPSQGVGQWLDSKRPWQFLSLALALVLVFNSGRGLLTVFDLSEGVSAGGESSSSALQASTQATAEAEALPVASELSRALAGSSPAPSGSSGSTSSHDGGHTSHPQEALFFLFNGVIFGTIILHLTMMPKLRGLQQTVVLFVLGIVYSLIQDGLGLTEHLGMMGSSYQMWMDIDPHLLAFTMLPVLLAGDAMTIDTNIARTVAKQCIYLAGPGVMVSAFLTALFLYVWLPYDWPFLLCLVAGSILAATDPVAVVGLLKELGASPTLTVQIQGESLLNDGTAIVLFSVAYSMLSGQQYDGGEIIIYLVKAALCAAGLGVIIGWVFYLWIRYSANRLEHNSSMTQSALTLCCAYWSFIISEGVLHISGVLCTVGASLVLADKMWPVIVDKESLHHVWHMFEYLGNTIIFFLAGALTGQSMTKIPWQDYLHLLVIYIVATIVRALILFCSRPILTWLSEDHAAVSAADCAVMTWGGLRGAVGLVLAMQVSRGRANDKISALDGDRVLFYVGGIATLTLIVNATTCPALVKLLGITATPAAKQRLLMQLYEQLSRLARDDKHPRAVKDALHTVLHDAQHHIEDLVSDKDKKPIWARAFNGLSAKFARAPNQRSAAELMKRFDSAKSDYDMVDRQVLELLDMPNVHWSDERCDRVKECIKQSTADGHMGQAVHEAFLSLIRAQYWHQIDAGEFTAGTNDAEMLLSTVSFAFKFTSRRLADFSFLKCYLQLVHLDDHVDEKDLTQQVAQDDADTRRNVSSTRKSSRRPSCEDESEAETLKEATQVVTTTSSHPSIMKLRRKLQTVVQAPKTPMQLFLEDSMCFNMSIAFVILMNAIFIAVEQSYRDDNNRNHVSWFILEIIFNAIFTGEFLIKLGVFKMRYFFSAWNLFDFTLVIIGLFGLGIEVIALTSEGGNDEDMSTEARLLRVNRVFRVLRIIRIFRLAKFIKILKARLSKKDLCLELAEHLQTITVLRAFVRAHAKAQDQFLNYLGCDGNFRTCEEARCLLDSQTEVYQAIAYAAHEAKSVDKSRLKGMAMLRSNIGATVELTEFIMDATKAGVINVREAECILHPIEDHMRKFYKSLQESQEGFEAEPEPERKLEHVHHETPGEDQDHSAQAPLSDQQPQSQEEPKKKEAWSLPGCASVDNTDGEIPGGGGGELMA